MSLFLLFWQVARASEFEVSGGEPLGAAFLSGELGHGGDTIDDGDRVGGDDDVVYMDDGPSETAAVIGFNDLFPFLLLRQRFILHHLLNLPMVFLYAAMIL